MASDIQRYLDNEPVEAGPPTLTYQLTKLYRRHRAAAVAMAAAVLVLFFGFALTSIAFARENELRKNAEQQRQIAEENAEAAKEQEQIAKRAAVRSQSTLDVLKSPLTKASPNPKVGPQVTVSELLRDFTADLDLMKLEDPAVEIEIRQTLAVALARFSMSKEEQRQWEKAERLARETYPPKSKELARFLYDRSLPLRLLFAVEYLE